MPASPGFRFRHGRSALGEERRGEERRDHDDGEVALHVEQQGNLRRDLHALERGRREPVRHEPEEREADGRLAQAEAKRRPDEEWRAEIGERGNDPTLVGLAREDDVRREDEAHVEGDELGQQRAPEIHESLAPGRPREDEGRGDQHAHHL